MGHPGRHRHRVQLPHRADHFRCPASGHPLPAPTRDRRRCVRITDPGGLLSLRRATPGRIRDHPGPGVDVGVVVAEPAHRELLAVRGGRGRRLVARLLLGRPAPGTRAGADHAVPPARVARRRFVHYKAGCPRHPQRVRAPVEGPGRRHPLFLWLRQRGSGVLERRPRLLDRADSDSPRQADRHRLVYGPRRRGRSSDAGRCDVA